MADLLLAPIIDATVSKVIGVASEQFNLAVGWKGDLKRFRDIMDMLQPLLQDADRKNVIRSRSDLKPWLLKLRAIADEADDVLEEVAYENMRRQFADRRWKKVRYFFTLSNPLLFRLRMALKVKSLNSRLADINASATQLGLQSRLAVTTVVETSADPGQTNSFLPSQVFGREEDVSKIESLLINDPTIEQDLPVIAIVGMPGLGKTTLAKAVYKSNKIREKFGKNVLWVSVSRDFKREEILQKLLESVDKGDGVNVGNEDAVMRKMQDALGDKSYLLILDDVWNEERQKWEWLRGCLLGLSKNKGNRVLVTTRSEGVALVMTQHILFPEVLSNDECWAIIKQRALGNATVPQGFEKVGLEISAKCKGLPLVASLTGATLQNKRDKREWEKILEDQVWQSLGRENGVLDIIKISYDCLPELALKRCFAFCSLFPKGSVMEKEMLIQLWMAVGFLQLSKDCHMEMEDVGDKYFRCLLSYSLFQEERRDELGRVISCKMHDLIHDFAEFISSFETMIFKEDSGGDIPGHVRHLNFTHSGGTIPANLGDIAPNLQTLFSKKDFSNAVQTDLKRLRILDLCYASDVKQLQTRLGNSKCLRYLDISGTEVEEFPKFVKKLYNLQTFRFMNCRNLKMPSEGLCNLKSLRHVYFDDEDQMPANLGRLTNLHTLQLFVVGTSKGRRIEELGSLSKLKGRLKIRKLECVKGKSEAERAKLHEKAVDELVLSWSYDREKVYDYGDDILEGLQPHPDLQRLIVEEFGGESLPSWMLKSLRGYHFDNLRDLQLQKCRKLKSIPVMEGFKSLWLLSLSDCYELIDGAFAFPSLVQLSIVKCKKLETLTVSGLQSLEKLSLYSCGVARIIGDGLSTCSCLKVLTLNYCDNLEFLPSGLSSCTALEELSILNCWKLETLTISGLQSLEKLSVSSCGVVRIIGDDLSTWPCFKVLTLKYCNNLEFLPSGLSSCTALEELSILNCWKLETLTISGLQSLEKLSVSSCGVARIIGDNLSTWPCLKVLTLKYCNNLEFLRSGLSSCTALEELSIICCEKLETLTISGLQSLEKLSVIDCRVTSIIGDDLSTWPCLKVLELNECNNLEFLPSGLSSCIALEELSIRDCKKLETLTVSGLQSLEKLSVSHCGVATIIGDDLSTWPCLKVLTLKYCNNLEFLPSGLSSCTALEELIISDCKKLETLTISGLQSLEKLSVSFCGVARIIGDDLSTWPCLKVLTLKYCNNLEFLPSGLSSCTALEELSIDDCMKLETLTISGLQSLEKLSLDSCGVVRIIGDDLSTWPCLKVLELKWCKNLEFLPSLYGLSSLQKLNIDGNKKLVHLPSGLSSCTALEVLSIRDCKNLVSISEELKELRSLVKLNIAFSPKLSSFPEESLGFLTSLKSLDLGPFSEDLEEYIGLNSIHHLHGSLKELTLSGWIKLTELPHQIQHLTALEDLTIEYFPELEALPDWLGDVPSLRRLKFYGCDNLKHLPSAQVIERLSKLKHFYIDWPELQEKINEVEWESTSGSE